MTTVVAATAAADLAYKICLCGECGVGKSWFLAEALHKLTGAPSPAQKGVMVTIAMDIRTLTLTHERTGKRVSLTVWDTAGQENMRDSIAPLYWRDAHAVLFVYDICSKDSYDARHWWIGRALRAAETNSAARDPYVVVIGNKADRAACYRQVPQQEASDECRHLNYSFMEVSALTGEHVPEAIMQLVDALLRRDGVADKPAASSSAATAHKREPPMLRSGSVSLVAAATASSSSPGGCCG